MASVDIIDVESLPLDSKRLWGRNIDAPLPGSRSDGYSFTISGWALGKSSRAATIQLVQFDRSIRTAPVDGIRPDVALLYSHVPDSGRCGFKIEPGVLGLRPQFDLRLEIILEDKTRVPVGSIRGFHPPIRSSFRPALLPLMVTTMGRTGSTWLMRMLGAHPQIVVDQKYPYETRAASYWMHMLRILSEPANHFQSARTTDFHSNLSWVGHHPFHSPPTTDTSQLFSWFRNTYPESVAAFCQGSIEEFYMLLARTQGRTRAAYFAEKYHNGYIPWLVWDVYPQAREVVLVRDPRDMLCSMLAFNAKLGTPGFGRHRADSDQDYVRQLAKYALRLYERWKIRSDKSYLLRYEDLVQRPVEVLKSLLEYLDLDRTESIIEEILRSTSDQNSESRMHQTSADAAASIGRWRCDLDRSLLPVCQEAFGEVLQKFGYEKD